MVKMLKAMALATAALIGLAACNGASSIAVDTLNKRSDGRGFVSKKNAHGRDYAVFVPVTYNPAKKYPMIVFLHGVGEGGTDITKPLSVGIAPFVQKSVAAQGDFDFIVLIPQSPSGYWDENSEAADDAIYAINQTCKDYAVDPDRISLTGLSTGGYGTWAIGAKYSSMFAALAPMGSSAACTDANAAKTLAKMHIWAIENSGDPFGGFGANGRSVDAVNAAGGHVKHTTYAAAGHNCWEQAYGDGELFAWLRATSRSHATVPSSATPTAAPKVTSEATPPMVLPTTPVSAAKAPAKPAANVEANGRAVVPTPY